MADHDGHDGHGRPDGHVQSGRHEIKVQ
jgi:hypothetical protein